MNAISLVFFIVGIGIASISKELNTGYGFVSGYWPALLGLVAGTGPYIYFQALNHAERIKAGEWINHFKANAFRFLVFSALILPINAYSWNWVRVIDQYIFAACFFGFLFNLCLNHFRQLPWDYISKSGKKRAITDKAFAWMPHGGKILILVELLGMAATGYVYVVS